MVSTNTLTCIVSVKWLCVVVCITAFVVRTSCCAICAQIDADFIAQYQMSYGCGETAESATETAESADSSQYSSDYWSNPPSDINSEEYRIWYERYCSYFYPQMATEAGITGSSVDTSNTVQPDTSSVSANNLTLNSAMATSAAVETERPDDATNDTTAGDAVAKKRKKGKKDGAANPKPAEPPGELPNLV